MSVQWKSSTVFAGEAVECTITFTNTSRPPRSPSPHTRELGLTRARWKDNLSSNVMQKAQKPSLQRSSSATPSLQAHTGNHKPQLSLGEPNGDLRPPSIPGNGTSISKIMSSGNKGHRRSVSIVSLGGDSIEGHTARGPPLRQRPGQIHTRAASLQILPKRSVYPSPKPSSGDDVLM